MSEKLDGKSHRAGRAAKILPQGGLGVMVTVVGVVVAVVGLLVTITIARSQHEESAPSVHLETSLWSSTATIDLTGPGTYVVPPETSEVAVVTNTGGSATTITGVYEDGQLVQHWAVLDPSTGRIVQDSLATVPVNGIRLFMIGEDVDASIKVDFSLALATVDGHLIRIPSEGEASPSAGALATNFLSACHERPERCPASL